MSAIVGIYYLDGRQADSSVLEQISKILAHRGPDRGGVWTKGPVGIAHRMLWTTPESLKEELPLTNRSNDLAITAAARIDNRDELIGMLELSDRSPNEISDSQLILAAYKKWGDWCPQRLLGDFAFAIWDESRQQLFCARDHMGVKPLFYYHSEHMFVFATEIKAIFCVPDVPHEINEIKVADHLATLFEDRASTFYCNIFRLPPAHSMVVNGHNRELRSYWSFDLSKNIRFSTDEQYSEAFRDIFTEAVRCRVRSAFPVGSTLSGGLDSSSIACVARNLMAKRGIRHLHTYSAIFPSLPNEDLKKIDERRYIRAVLGTGGFEAHFIQADRLSPLLEIDQMMHDAGEPVQGPNLYMHRALYQSAKKHHVRVFLDGIDGDTTVSHGLEYLRELARRGRWWALSKEARALARVQKISAWKPVWHLGIKPLIPEYAWRVFRTLLGRNGSNGAVNGIINPEFARRLNLATRIEQQSARAKHVQTARESHLYSLMQGLHSHALQQLDNTSASLELEPRYPFFDRRLMEFCLALPPEQKLGSGWQRIIMRRAMEGILPREVQWRPNKANLSPNLTTGLLKFEKKTVEDIILNNPGSLQRYINMDVVRSVCDRYLSDPLHKAQYAVTLYNVLTLGLWLRQQQNPWSPRGQ